MTEFDINLPVTVDADLIGTVVEDVCAEEMLHVTMKSSLKQYPGCVHWHFKQGKAPGVLEATWWPRTDETKPSRLWLSVHGNRTADWIESLIPRLKILIEARLTQAP